MRCTIRVRRRVPGNRVRKFPLAHHRAVRTLVGDRGSCSKLSKSVSKEGVDNVHRFGFGLGRTHAGLARIPYAFGSSQCSQGRECSSSPTSGTCFPCSGACGPLNVYKPPLWAPAGAHFCCGCCLLSCLGKGVAGYTFMAGRATKGMTRRWMGEWFALAGLHSLMSLLFMATYPGKRMTVRDLLAGSARRDCRPRPTG